MCSLFFSFFFLFRTLREKDVSKHHIQLSLAILLMLTMALVLVGLSAEKVYGGCVTVSVFVHYFALTSVVWMGAEALHAYVPETGHCLCSHNNQVHCYCINHLLV